MNWISSGGGPFILLPDSLLKFWNGVFIEDQLVLDSRPTDYDRAGKIIEYAGILEVGPGSGIVLGEEPMLTAWQPFEESKGGIFIRWRWADSEQEVESHISRLPQDLAWENHGEIYFNERVFKLFDAAEPGLDIIGESLELELSPGTYTIGSCGYSPDSQTSVVLVCLTLKK